VGLEPPIVLGDGAYGDITELRTGLEERGIGYMLGVKGATSAYGEQVQPERPEWSGRGRPPGARYRAKPSSLRGLALAAGKDAAIGISWREGTRGRMHSRFLALRVRPAS
jgi:SRSO17 transposase